jgi:hypothetical protein
LSGKEVRQWGFDFLPRHAIGQNSQGMTQVDHLIGVVRKKSAVMDIWASRTPRKKAQLNINVGVLNIGNDPES